MEKEDSLLWPDLQTALDQGVLTRHKRTRMPLLLILRHNFCMIKSSWTSFQMMRRTVGVATEVASVLLVMTIASAWALDCHGRLVLIGASPWEVKERCGEPSAIDGVMKQFPQRAYDPISQTTVYILVPVQQSIWTSNVGPTRFMYYLTFRREN